MVNLTSLKKIVNFSILESPGKEIGFFCALPVQDLGGRVSGGSCPPGAVYIVLYLMGT